MIRTLTLVDFMAHAHTELELGAGLNVLCGPNNTGKSAVVEALRCLSANPTPRHVIRHGAKQARVEALTDDGWRVAWVRRKAYALYELTPPGGETMTFAKLGRGKVPEEVARVLKLGPVGADKGEAVDVHLGDQRHPIFLLDKPGTTLADFLASSTESAHLMAMQDLLREKVRRAKLAQRACRESLEGVHARLDRLAPLPGLTLGVENLAADLDDLEARLRAEPELDRLAGRIREAFDARRALGRRVERLSALTAPAPLAPARPLAERLAALAGLGRRLARTRERLAALTALAPAPALADSRELAALVAARTRLEDRKALSAARAKALAGLSAPPAPADPSRLAALAGKLAELGARTARGREVVAGQARELEALSVAIAARLAEVGQCPLCGGELDAARFLSGSRS